MGKSANSFVYQHQRLIVLDEIKVPCLFDVQKYEEALG